MTAPADQFTLRQLTDYGSCSDGANKPRQPLLLHIGSIATRLASDGIDMLGETAFQLLQCLADQSRRDEQMLATLAKPLAAEIQRKQHKPMHIPRTVTAMRTLQWSHPLVNNALLQALPAVVGELPTTAWMNVLRMLTELGCDIQSVLPAVATHATSKFGALSLRDIAQVSQMLARFATDPLTHHLPIPPEFREFFHAVSRRLQQRITEVKEQQVTTILMAMTACGYPTATFLQVLARTKVPSEANTGKGTFIKVLNKPGGAHATPIETQIDRVREFVATKRKLVVFSGAGISTEAGIRDLASLTLKPIPVSDDNDAATHPSHRLSRHAIWFNVLASMMHSCHKQTLVGGTGLVAYLDTLGSRRRYRRSVTQHLHSFVVVA